MHNLLPSHYTLGTCNLLLPTIAISQTSYALPEIILLLYLIHHLFFHNLILHLIFKANKILKIFLKYKIP